MHVSVKHLWGLSVVLHCVTFSLISSPFAMPHGKIVKAYGGSTSMSETSTERSSSNSQWPVIPKGKGKGKQQYDDMRWSASGRTIQLRQCFNSNIQCSFCKDVGHHTSNCVRALEARVKHVAVDCARGRHQPYLHGCWRCDWCGIHIYERDVIRNNYDVWQKSTLMQEELKDRWMLSDAERERMLRQ